jgi:small subunit ribosomal protein S1
VVDLPDDVEGFIPMSHLALPDISRVEARFGPGDPLPLEVIEVSPENRRIVLSVKAYMDKQTEATVAEYVAAHDIRPELLAAQSEQSGDGGVSEGSAAAEAPEEAGGPEGEEIDELVADSPAEPVVETPVEAAVEEIQEPAPETGGDVPSDEQV